MLLCVEGSQLWWFGHLARMPPGHLTMEVFQTCPAGRRLQGRPRFRKYIYALAWECLGMGGCGLGKGSLGPHAETAASPTRTWIGGERMDERMNGWMDGWLDGWMDGWMKGRLDGWMDGWMVSWMDGWSVGWMDGWMDRSLCFDKSLPFCMLRTYQMYTLTHTLVHCMTKCT